MGAAWIDGADVGASLREQARNMALRLGHRMTDWLARPGNIHMARCVDCYEAATVAVRRFARAPIAGAAVWFRCRPRKLRNS
ncbi:MAG TPA: hypothetical protein VKE22_04405 [Haliangiales bacterium]|nr:hypothetical protein [Haliangiales bacterium]